MPDGDFSDYEIYRTAPTARELFLRLKEERRGARPKLLISDASSLFAVFDESETSEGESVGRLLDLADIGDVRFVVSPEILREYRWGMIEKIPLSRSGERLWKNIEARRGRDWLVLNVGEAPVNCGEQKRGFYIPQDPEDDRYVHLALEAKLSFGAEAPMILSRDRHFHRAADDLAAKYGVCITTAAEYVRDFLE